MKYKAELKIKVEFECNNEDELKIKTWESIGKPFHDCIFGDKKDEEYKFVTLTDENGNIVNLKEMGKK